MYVYTHLIVANLLTLYYTGLTENTMDLFPYYSIADCKRLVIVKSNLLMSEILAVHSSFLDTGGKIGQRKNVI